MAGRCDPDRPRYRGDLYFCRPEAHEFFEFGGHSYRLTSDLLTWREAEAEAVRLGGHLVAINSQEEQDFISRNFPKSLDLWIGLSRQRTSKTFAWSSGEPLIYTNWHPTEPNNLENSEECVTMSAIVSSWNDTSGDSSLLGIIEIP